MMPPCMCYQAFQMFLSLQLSGWMKILRYMALMLYLILFCSILDPQTLCQLLERPYLVLQ